MNKVYLGIARLLTQMNANHDRLTAVNMGWPFAYDNQPTPDA